MVGLLSWDRCEQHLPWVRAIRSELGPHEVITPHRHDFAELLWVLEGSVVHRRLDGSDELLGPGAARFFRPGEGHHLGGGPQGGALTSASLPAELFAELDQRYATHAGWPWTAATRDQQVRPGQLATLQGVIAGIPHEGQERADAEWFAASVVRALRPPRNRETLPEWLALSLQHLRTDAGLLAGLAGVVRHSARNEATVSRAVRRHFGCTASALVLQIRLEHAAQRLHLDGTAILDVALACGFKDLGHFYRAFRAQYHTTPKAWRDSAVGR